MTLVADQPLVARLPAHGISIGDTDRHNYRTEDPITKYLERWSEIDDRTSLPLNDRCAVGLLEAMRKSVLSLAVDSPS
jgi:hypothetical protein